MVTSEHLPTFWDRSEVDQSASCHGTSWMGQAWGPTVFHLSFSNKATRSTVFNVRCLRVSKGTPWNPCKTVSKFHIGSINRSLSEATPREQNYLDAILLLDKLGPALTAASMASLCLAYRDLKTLFLAKMTQSDLFWLSYFSLFEKCWQWAEKRKRREEASLSMGESVRPSLGCSCPSAAISINPISCCLCR